ncbi:CSS motif domain associated with EAL family protein [Bordetella holmesii ATCC 51541]|nr:CSS motif domain associated with EAL family protein [Bordetella holmesii ATCC 51541]
MAVGYPPGRWLRLVNGSPFVLERPALLAGTAGPGERHAIAVIDSQYLQDLLDSVAALSNHRIELKIDGGMTLASCPARDLIYEPRAYGAQSASVSFMSQNVPVDIRIFSPASQV